MPADAFCLTLGISSFLGDQIDVPLEVDGEAFHFILPGK